MSHQPAPCKSCGGPKPPGKGLKFCGQACLEASPAHRLLSRLRPEGECLVYTGPHDAYGYGSLPAKPRRILAHRLAWTLEHGPIAAGMNVLHHCDNPPCCKPSHLFLGTIADNNRDRHAKGRTVMPTNGPDYQRIKTHCPQGHPYSGANLRLRPNGSRRCAACYYEWGVRYKTANRDLINARRRERRPSRSKRNLLSGVA